MLYSQEIDPISCSLASTFTPIMGLTEPVPLKFCNCTLCQFLLPEVLLGLLFSALKQLKVANFSRAEPTLLEMESFMLHQKTTVQPPEMFVFSYSEKSDSFFRISKNLMGTG